MKRLQSKAITFALALVLLIAGCASPPADDSSSSGLSEEAVKASAQQAIEYMNAKDFETITSTMVQEDAKEALSADVLASAHDQLLSDAGGFKEYGKSEYAADKDENGMAYGIIALEAQYENKNILYTIGFNQDMKIILFYMK